MRLQGHRITEIRLSVYPLKLRDNTMAKSPSKQTSPAVSTLASGVLSGRVKPTATQIKTLAATALGQDQTKGNRR